MGNNEKEEERRLINISPDQNVEYQRDARFSSYPGPSEQVERTALSSHRVRSKNNIRNSNLRNTVE